MKTNEEYLRELIAHDDEAIEFLDALIQEYKDKLEDKELDEDELEEANEKIKELEEKLNLFETVDLGLDKLHYRLENGNLKIREKLESLLRRANTIPNAEPLFT